MMKVFIHTNHKQMLGALVAKHCLERNTAHREGFTVELIRLQDHPHLTRRQGAIYKRKGIELTWDNEDLQSFTPLRFLPPQLMAYQGRAVVIDPDVFALGDIHELLTMKMGGKAILCRRIEGSGGKPSYYASSVMLLDCAMLKHWRWEEAIDEMFAGARDYRDWMSLSLEDPDAIGCLSEEWNSFDRLTGATKLLHNTGRLTQPWKTGLPVDFSTIEKQQSPARLPPKWGIVPRPCVDAAKRLLGRPIADTRSNQGSRVYLPHPDKRQVELFFTMLSECLSEGTLSKDLITAEVAKGHVRSDALELLAQRPMQSMINTRTGS